MTMETLAMAMVTFGKCYKSTCFRAAQGDYDFESNLVPWDLF
jgi:hypothetical protein